MPYFPFIERSTWYNKNMNSEIQAYNNVQSEVDSQICNTLMRIIQQHLPTAVSKVWHAHPVWFLDGNPIVGYSKLKDDVRLMFWSGQSFEEDGLEPDGSFMAATARYTDSSQIDELALTKWLKKAKTIQWDYKHIAQRKGKLIKLDIDATEL